ncbi:MAG: hypothetical protein QOK72_09345 [Nitrososphaeraceae archaeon]|nr:hypothetical protein [Nitrososphaeraceae archaeon]MDW3626835.1 hypothetical protein [Nitrososphaeraceae archaeon]
MIDKEDTTKKSLDSHTSFEDYKNDVGKLKKMAEQVAFTIIYQAIRYNRLEEYKKVILQLSTSNMERG